MGRPRRRRAPGTPRATRRGRRRPASYGNSALRMSPPMAREAARGLDDDPPARLAGEPLAGDERERERLHEQGQVERPAGAGDLGDEAFLVGRVRGVRVVVDEELGGRCAEALDLLDAPAIEHAAYPGRLGAEVPGRLDGDDEAGPLGHRPVVDGLGRADLGVEQRPGRHGRQRPDDRPLELDHLLVGHRIRGVGPELAAEVLAMVEGEDGERPARRRAGAEAPPGPQEVRHGRVRRLGPPAPGVPAAAIFRTRAAFSAYTLRRTSSGRPTPWICQRPWLGTGSVP